MAIQAADWAAANGMDDEPPLLVPTTDVPLASLPSLLPWFNKELGERLLPALSNRYPEAADVRKLRVLDCFLVRYAAGAIVAADALGQSLLSFTIQLNGPSEYEGGGTWFEKLGMALDGGGGRVVMFPGKVEHGGAPITSGERYVIVLFMGYARNKSAPPGGRCAVTPSSSRRRRRRATARMSCSRRGRGAGCGHRDVFIAD